MNADCLLNKRAELKIRIAQLPVKPDIIAVVEVKAKNCNEFPLLSEFTMEGYEVHSVNLNTEYGRGVILYTALWMKVSPYSPDGPELDSLWLLMKLNDKDKLILGCVYRSPSSFVKIMST